MNLRSLTLLSACLLSAPVMAQTTQPAAPSTQPVKVAAVPADLTGVALAARAQMAFNRGEYAAALPMLQKLASEADAQGNPAKLGSIQERIRVSEKALAAIKA